MARKIKLGWNEKQDDRFSAALDLGIKMHKEIEAGPDFQSGCCQFESD
jgi:hypothetical protein